MSRERFDPLSPAVLPNPYPHYARLRQEDPIHWGVADDAGLPGRWYIVRFADVMAILKDGRFGREVEKHLPTGAVPPVAPADAGLKSMADTWMILRDPPVHTRLRALVVQNYTPRRVEALRPFITQLADQLVDDILAHGPPLDLLSHFTLPLTVRVTAHVLGLPQEDYAQLMPWSRALAAVIDFNQEAGLREQSRRAVEQFTAYLRELIAARRRRPADDLISSLVALENEGRVQDEAELVGSLTHLLFVGNDPVMHQLGLGVLNLLRQPDQFALLHSAPALLANAVDELLRYDSPVQATFRYALKDVVLQDKTIRTGDHIALMLAAANRDPVVCPDPERLDVRRPVGQVSTFGAGVHYCLGAPLARLEGEIALHALIQRLPNLAVTSEQLAWPPTIAVRGPLVLTVTF